MAITGEMVFDVCRQPTKEEPFENAQHERSAQEQAQSMAAALQPYLMEPVTPKNLTRVRIAIMRVIYQDGWYARLIAHKAEHHGEFVQAMEAETTVIYNLLPALEELTRTIDHQLANQELSWDDWMTTPEGGGLNEPALRVWREKMITIDDLFLLDPHAVLGMPSQS